jgi:hypothetical protein
MKLLLGPGDLVADIFGLPQDAEHRMIFRTYCNTLFWTVVISVAAAFAAA